MTTDAPEVTYRPLVADDERFLREMLFEALYVRAGDKPFARSVLDEPQIRRYVAHFGDASTDAGFAALVDGERAGACWIRLLTGDDRGYGWVADDVPELTIALTAGHRGRGMGSALLELVVHQAADLGCRSVSLSVDPDSPARRLYERAGFVHVGWNETSMTMRRHTP